MKRVFETGELENAMR